MKAYYIKLGSGGEWEKDAIVGGRLRLGWETISLDDINQRRWPLVRSQLGAEIRDKGAATRDFNALTKITESTEDDVWITFHDAKLWWCRLKDGPVEVDGISKFRITLGGWSDATTNGRRLFINTIPGSIAALQGFRGTACTVHETDRLWRLINGQQSDEFIVLDAARSSLATAVVSAMKSLHWKDFETLVDLVFRGSGWRRLSLLGEQMKFADMELQDPITGELFQVQVKSIADVSDFEEYEQNFSGSSFSRLFFVVHSPTSALVRYKPSSARASLIFGERLAEMVIDVGLTRWLMEKVA